MDMIVVLADVVDHRRVLRREGFLADVLDALAVVLRAGAGELVAVVDVGEVMLVVMELQRLLRHVGRERVVGIREFGQLEGHRDISCRYWLGSAGKWVEAHARNRRVGRGLISLSHMSDRGGSVQALSRMQQRGCFGQCSAFMRPAPMSSAAM